MSCLGGGDDGIRDQHVNVLSPAAPWVAQVYNLRMKKGVIFSAQGLRAKFNVTVNDNSNRNKFHKFGDGRTEAGS